MVDAAPVATPTVKGESRKPDEEVADEATSRHIRNMCGQLLHIAQERVDILWMAKGNAKTVSKPSINDDFMRCKRVARYPKATRGYEATLAPQQDADGLLHVAVDSEWGASHGRRPTSAGVSFYRSAMVNAFSRTQGLASLSTAGAEGFALGAGVCEGFFIRSILLELNEQVRMTWASDSSLEIAAARRLGLGKMKHVSIIYVFVQELVRSGPVALVNLPTGCNPADIATNALDQLTIEKHLAACGVMVRTVNRAADKKDVPHLNGHTHDAACIDSGISVSAGMRSWFGNLGGFLVDVVKELPNDKNGI